MGDSEAGLEVLNAFAARLGLDASTWERADVLRELSVDSLTLMELVTALEQEVGRCLPDDALRAIRTVGDIVDWLALDRPSG